MHAASTYPRHDAQAFGLSVKGWMFEKAANEFRDMNVSHVEINQSVAWMAERLFEKMFILSEQRCAVKTVQKGNQILVFNSAARDFFANLPE